jgi:ubiquinone/menaquinone biosynthesis C-methylase UbiE
MSIVPVALVVALVATPQDAPKNAWHAQYKDRAAVARAEQLESPSRPVYRYRVAITSLLQLKPGMTAAEIGAGSGFIARLMAPQVGPQGRVIAVEPDPAMVAYMNERARAEGLANFAATQGRATATGLDPQSVDAMAVVNALSAFERPAEMLQSMAAALKTGGVLLVVDFPRVGEGATASGLDVEEAEKLVSAAGFDRINESSIVPGQYALRFRKR